MANEILSKEELHFPAVPTHRIFVKSVQQALPVPVVPDHDVFLFVLHNMTSYETIPHAISETPHLVLSFVLQSTAPEGDVRRLREENRILAEVCAYYYCHDRDF